MNGREKSAGEAAAGCGCASLFIISIVAAKLAAVAVVVWVIVWALRSAGAL